MRKTVWRESTEKSKEKKVFSQVLTFVYLNSSSLNKAEE